MVSAVRSPQSGPSYSSFYGSISLLSQTGHFPNRSSDLGSCISQMLRLRRRVLPSSETSSFSLLSSTDRVWTGMLLVPLLLVLLVSGEMIQDIRH